MERILLVEPDYSNKYPPIGLMKIATYYKNKGDYVEFYKGKAPFTTISKMDKIFITSLFTFYYDITVETIKHYLNYKNKNDVYIGGIAVTLMKERFSKDTGLDSANILCGQLSDSDVLGYSDHVNIDVLPLDYDILDDITYKYPAGDNFFVYATRGCPRKCKFCAVRILEPQFYDTNNLMCQINYIRKTYGDKRHILLMDNNVLFSNSLQEIAENLIELGFAKDNESFVPPNQFEVMVNKIERRRKAGNSTSVIEESIITFLESFKTRIKKQVVLEELEKAINELKTANDFYESLQNNKESIYQIIEKYRNKKKLQRYVDFNQGIDARLLTDEKMTLIEGLALRPFRLAYDNIRDTDIYQNAFEVAYRHGVRYFSNYMLYNFEDSPSELWNRINNNIKLYNKYDGITAFSFPMKYAPIDMTDRSYVGKYWNKKYLSAMNVILNVTKGVIAKEEDFFIKAFGRNPDEFEKILAMPNEFIKYRFFFEERGYIRIWNEAFDSLLQEQKKMLLEVVSTPVKERVVPTELEFIHKLYTITKHQVDQKKVKLEDFYYPIGQDEQRK